MSHSKLRISNPPGVHAPAPSYAHVAEDTETGTIWVAGQVGLLPNGELAGPDMASQLRQIVANYDAILASLGLDRSAFVKRTVFVTDMDEYFSEAMTREVRAIWTERPFPSTLVGVTRLYDPRVKIEVEAVLKR